MNGIGVCLFVFFSQALFGKVYDCFPFFNEHEILEIRLNELYDHVDYFVIAESCESHRGLPKPYHFENNRERYAKFLDKIIYLKVGTVKASCPWDRENWHKNKVIEGLNNCQPDDLVLFSDADEIPSHTIIAGLKEAIKKHPIILIRQRMYQYFLNRFWSDSWLGTIAMRGDQIALPHLGGDRWMPNHVRVNLLFNNTCQELQKQGPFPIWEAEGGWHFTSMGGYDRYIDKWTNSIHWDNIPHAETYSAWRSWVEGKQLVPIDASFPKYVKDHLQYFIDVGLIDLPMAN